MIDPARLDSLYSRLLAAHGPQYWWPAQTRFEILIGAVLVQNTAWRNVEQAIANLRTSNCLTAEAILAEPSLAERIRPSGYYRVKAARLRALCEWFVQAGGFAALDVWPAADLRRGLLAVKGVGFETADVILLYVFGWPVFVADAYAQRILSRLGWVRSGLSYEQLRTTVEAAAPEQAAFLNELHALLVVHGKHCCRPRPICGNCVLRHGCVTGRAHVASS